MVKFFEIPILPMSTPLKFLFLENAEPAGDVSKLQEQFNAQRARMKELYLQKEKECVQMKQKMILLKKELDEKDSQLGKQSPGLSVETETKYNIILLVIAEYNRQKDLEDQKENSQQEILTLQQLLQETCDEATLANNEITRLSDENERGRHEVMALNQSLNQLQQVTLRHTMKQSTNSELYFRTPTRV